MNIIASHPPRLSSIEPLETRIAPASVFVFTDVDGDEVTVKSSTGTLSAANFTFGPVQTDELQSITLDADFENTALGITVKSVPGGDGRVNVGAILANGVDLKSVSITGDLGRIEAGSGEITALGAIAPGVGLGSLTVDSLGRGGLALQGPGASLASSIDGNLGKLTVKGDIFQASFYISGNLGATTINGSLIGGVDASSGLISTGTNDTLTGNGNVGPVKIGGSIVGGAGENSGQIFAPGTIASLAVGGDIAGGTGDRSGWVYGSGGLGAVSVKGSILGNSNADPGFSNVGFISTDNTIKSVTVGGDIIGGAGTFGGYVFAEGAIGAVKVTGDVRGDSSVAASVNVINGDARPFNGGIQSATSIGNVLVGGSLIGGLANYSGVIFVGNDDLAGDTARPGVPLSGDPGENDGISVDLTLLGNIGSVTIKGSVIGGGLLHTFPNGFSGAASGWIKADGAIGAVKITGDVTGSVGSYSGVIQARGVGLADTASSIASVSVGGSMRGGAGFDSGSIFAGSPDIILDIAPTATAIGNVKIGGSLISGQGTLSGTLYSDTFIKSVTINGSILGDADGAADFAINGGGAIESGGDLGPIKIKGSVIGGNAPGGGGIYAYGGDIKSVSIGRDLTGATATTGIYSAGTIGSVTVGGSIVGAAPGAGTVFILADGIQNPESAAQAVAIGKITVKGRVENADILAGSDFYNFAIGAIENADAQIGSVSVDGDWIASNLAAGTNSTGNPFFGENGVQSVAGSDLSTVPSRIAAITIKGSVFGTPDSGIDGFGFFAQQIGSLKIHGVTQTLPPATGGTILLGDPIFTDTVVTIFGVI